MASPLASSVCPGCGTAFRCGMAAGDAECWCVKLPHVMPVPAANATPSRDAAPASCYCPVCLQQKLIADAKSRLPAQD
jgi:hypothetical protein